MGWETKFWYILRIPCVFPVKTVLTQARDKKGTKAHYPSSWQAEILERISQPLKLPYLVTSEGIWGGLKRTSPIDLYIQILGPLLVELFGRNEKVWPCWRRCAIGGVNSPCQSQLALSALCLQNKWSFQLLLHPHGLLACWQFSAMMVRDSNLLEMFYNMQFNKLNVFL